jgi:hypothetical protein
MLLTLSLALLLALPPPVEDLPPSTFPRKAVE